MSALASLRASLPMYDLPELATAHAALLAALEREVALATGVEGALFTQVCGYPLVGAERGRYAVLAAPCYALPGCEGPTHRAFIVVRTDAPYHSLEDLRGAVFAFNDRNSNTGVNLPRRLFAPFARNGRFFGRTLASGSHETSLALIAAGAADAASIDCVTYGLLELYRPRALRGLRVLASTVPSPAPPFVTAASADDDLVTSLSGALGRLFSGEGGREARDTLRLTRIAPATVLAYRVLLKDESDALALGYPQIA
jgi:ABC-type phosphate/phosphonate transport system substrate-binding protein